MFCEGKTLIIKPPFFCYDIIKNQYLNPPNLYHNNLALNYYVLSAINKKNEEKLIIYHNSIIIVKTIG